MFKIKLAISFEYFITDKSLLCALSVCGMEPAITREEDRNNRKNCVSEAVREKSGSLRDWGT